MKKDGLVRTESRQRIYLLRKAAILVTICLMAVSFLALSVSAAEKKNTWELKNDYYYYYNSKGKKATGLTKIGGKYYYFDKKGRQLVGWRKIKKSIYRFGMGNAEKGYMLKNQWVDRVKLGKNGKAVVSTKLAKRTAEILVNYTLWGDKITKPTWEGSKKLNACAKAIAKFSYKADSAMGYANGWHVAMAEDCYKRYINKYQYFECQRYAVAFAYLCKAVGLKQVEIHIGGDEHGWVKVNGVSYDPTRYAKYGGDNSLEITDSDREKYDVYKDLKTYKLYSVN